MSTIFIIDIGSNSVRLGKIVDGVTVFKRAEITRLAQGLNTSGVLSRQKMQLTADTVCAFAALSRQQGGKPYAFATAAVRRAANGNELTELIESKCGLQTEVISGGLEAKLGYIGAGGLSRDGCTVVDIGGASTEVVSGLRGEISYQSSFPLGVVALKECGRNRESLQQAVDKIIPDLWDVVSGKAYAVGGTATTLAAAELKLKEYSPAAVNGYCMDIESLKSTSEALLETPPDVIATYPGIQSGREDVIAEGAFLLYNILKKLGVKRCTVSDGDNLEGYAIYRGLI